MPSELSPADALRRALELAQHAEQWGYHRFWLAENHNMVGIASAATAVVIGYVAGGTRTIRVCLATALRSLTASGSAR